MMDGNFLYQPFSCVTECRLSSFSTSGRLTLKLVIGVKAYFVLLRCDSIEKLKAQLPKMEQELKDQGKFKDFYQFTFNFAKNPGQKGLGKQSILTFLIYFHSLLCSLDLDFSQTCAHCCAFSRLRNGNCVLEFSTGWKIQIPGPVEQIFSGKLFSLN